MTEQASQLEQDTKPDRVPVRMLIFPCVPRDKAPLTEHGWHDATDDPDQLRKWARRWPEANWAVALGPSGLVAMDAEGIVKHGRDGVAEWERVKGKLGIDDDGALIDETPSRGLAVLFADPTGEIRSIPESKLGDRGLEVKGNGGYVMLPGSFAICQGANGVYRGPYTPLSDWTQPVRVLPEALREALLEAQGGKGANPTDDDQPVTLTPTGEGIGGVYWLDRARERAKTGNRHNTGLWLAQQLRAATLTQADARKYMISFAKHCEALGACKDPAEKHMLKVLADVYGWADFDKAPATFGGPLPTEPEWMAEAPNGNGSAPSDDLPPEPGYLADAPDVSDLTPGADVIPAMGQHVRVVPKLWTGADLLSTAFPDPVWTVPDLLPAGLAILAGRPKLGKSFLGLQLAIALDSGGRFLDYALDPAGVVYLALEDSPRRIKTRLTDMKAPGSCKEAPGSCGVRFFFDWPALNGPGLAQLVAEMQREPPRLVIIDTVSRAVGGRIDWDDVGSVTGIMARLQAVAKDHDTTVLLIDHHRKGGADGYDVIDDVLGSTGKTGVADTVWGLYRERGKKGATLKTAGRDIEEQELAMIFDVATRCWQRTEDAHGVKVDTLGAKILDMIREAGNLTTKEIADALDLDAAQVNRELAELCDDKHAIERLKWDGRRGVPYAIVGAVHGAIDINRINPINRCTTINPHNPGDGKIDTIDRMCTCKRPATHEVLGAWYCERCAPGAVAPTQAVAVARGNAALAEANARAKARPYVAPEGPCVRCGEPATLRAGGANYCARCNDLLST